MTPRTTWKWLSLALAVVLLALYAQPRHVADVEAKPALREAAELFRRASDGPHIRGTEFLEGMRALLPWLDRLGVARLVEVNIHKLEKQGLDNQSLERVLDVDRDKRADDSATVAALWTGRVLEFLGAFVDILAASDLTHTTQPLHAVARQAYEATLMRHHGAFLRQAARALFAMIPDHVALFERSLGYPRDQWATRLKADLRTMAHATHLLLAKLRAALDKHHVPL